ncbi:hypothetical protein [Akkermansia sp. 54_46]|jgi:DUF971 family protein|uniref:hypothetical protein n=1 Tax=Akkermansia sp. 54_46 TaxID=1896967 RepID=UPI00095B7D99|nr:hypothetical protein [Akkermansia sp. 54_46]OLA87863.1 MAG: hypothetical protein BHW66_12760 [Akkermansia sp. 54_46]
MKISYHSITARQVYDARLGENKVKAIYRGDVKIYPDNAARISQIRLDISAWSGTPDGSFWEQAIEAVSVYASTSRYIKMTADRTYMVGSTWGSYPLASYRGAGLFEFAYNEGPLLQNVRLGDSASLQIKLPSLKSFSIGGTQEFDQPVSRVYPACPSGTEVRGYFGKGQKRVSTGVRIVIVSLPSGQVLLDRHQQQNGHCRGSYDWNYGWVGSVAGDTQARLEVYPHQPRGGWGGYFIYPAASCSLTARIIQIVPEA